MIKQLQKFKTSGKALKYTANFIFLVISCLLITNLLVQLVNEQYIKIIFVFVAIGLDIFRQYVVALGKAYWRIDLVKSLSCWLVYLIHVSVVIIASTGFALSAINAKSETAGVYNMEKQSIISNIQSNEIEIKELEAAKSKIPDYNWDYRRISGRIDALQKKNTELYVRLENFKEIKLDVQKDIYDTLGRVLWNTEGEIIKVYMLVVLAFLIELALLVTSWDIKVKQKSTLNESEGTTKSTLTTSAPPEKALYNGSCILNENQKELLEFTEALFSDTKKLNGDQVVAKKTGIPPERCAKYRRFLNELRIGDQPVIRKKQGGCVSNFPKEEIEDYIKTNALLEVI